jgi:hypothetical protein
VAPGLLDEAHDADALESPAAGLFGDGESGPAELDDLLPHRLVPARELMAFVDGVVILGHQYAELLHGK